MELSYIIILNGGYGGAKFWVSKLICHAWTSTVQSPGGGANGAYRGRFPTSGAKITNRQLTIPPARWVG